MHYIIILLAIPVLASCSTTQTSPSYGVQQSVSKSIVSSTELVKIQTLLNDGGFDSGGIDGTFGPKTSAAIGRFQAKASIGPVDGRATTELIAQLETYLKLQKETSVSQVALSSVKETENTLTKKEASVSQVALSPVKEADKHLSKKEASVSQVALLPVINVDKKLPAAKAVSNQAGLELPPVDPNWTEKQQEQYKRQMSSIRKTTNACKNGESEDCYFAGLKLVDLGHSYNLKKNVTKSYSRLRRTFNKESAITYYRLARQHYERDCKLDNYGGCSHIYYVTDVIGVLDPYADEDSYPRYIADAKKGDEQAIKLLNDAYLAMHEKMYQYGLVANPSKTQMDGYEKLSSMQAFMGPKIGEISKENTLALMQILLVRAQETQDIDYSRGVTRLYRDSGFKYGNTEIDHFAQLVVEQAGYYFAETSRGYKNVMKGVEPLLVSPHENVRKEAAAFYKFAESEARRAPPPRDSFSAALAERLINNWTKPTDANTELAADTMAGGIALDLWLK